METKVYLVIKTFIDGESIVLGAFSTEEKAVEYLRKEKDVNHSRYGSYSIEKYELDKEHSGR